MTQVNTDSSNKKNIIECYQCQFDGAHPITNLHIIKGQLTAIIGPSGCGKSSLLLTLSGVKKPFTGEVRIFEQDPHAISEAEWMNNRLKIAHVLPSGSLVSHLTVLQNVMLPLNYHQTSSNNEIQEKAFQMLDWLDCQANVTKLPSKLSEYERRIVNLARALMLNPEILFIDDAFANFDLGIKNKLTELYTRINKDKNTTIVMATNDLHSAGKCSQQFIFLDNTDILEFTSWKQLTESNNITVLELLS